jgi:hypothetical protein
MKTIILIFSLLTLNAHADINHAKEISNTSLINLAGYVSEKSFSIPYPGPTISGVCSVEIRADSFRRSDSIEKLLGAIEIVNDLGIVPVVSVKNNMTILLDFTAANNMYGTWFTIRTKGDESLENAIINTLGQDRKVVLVGVCP